MNTQAPQPMPAAAAATVSKTRERSLRRVTLVGSIGNLLLCTFKFVAGILGRSGAMVADAVHSLSDLATDAVVLIFVHVSARPQDSDHEYGHGKYETLATALIGIALMAVGGFLMADSIGRIIRWFGGEEIPRPGWIALIAAVVSIVIKEALYRYTVKVGRRWESPAVVANAWHHRSDALSSLGTLIGIGGAILLGQRWTVLDPIAAVVVSVLIIKVAAELLGQSAGELLEKALPKEAEQRILEVVETFPEVRSPHNLRTRRIGSRTAIDIHVRMPGDMTVSHSHNVTLAIEQRLRTIFGADAIVNIHVEPYK